MVITNGGHGIHDLFAIELQNVAGEDVTFGKTRSLDRPGQYSVVYEYAEREEGVAAGELALRLIASLLPEKIRPKDSVPEGWDWPAARELITRSIRETRDIPGIRLASGCGTDQLDPGDARGVDDVLRAYTEQMAAIQALGGRIILMASRALARVARSPEDYRAVYRRVGRMLTYSCSPGSQDTPACRSAAAARRSSPRPAPPSRPASALRTG